MSATAITREGLQTCATGSASVFVRFGQNKDTGKASGTPITNSAGASGRSTPRRPVVSVALMLLGLAGCGYTVGAPYNAEIRSVYVPIFRSESYRRGWEYQLTEAVQRQIQMRTPFRLAKEENADSRLTGRIVRTDKAVLGLTPYSDARELQVNLLIEVTWEDLRNQKVLQTKQFEVSPDIVQLNTQSSYAPEVGQSLATGSQQAVDQLARNIVDMMETPW